MDSAQRGTKVGKRCGGTASDSEPVGPSQLRTSWDGLGRYVSASASRRPSSNITIDAPIRSEAACIVRSPTRARRIVVRGCLWRSKQATADGGLPCTATDSRRITSPEGERRRSGPLRATRRKDRCRISVARRISVLRTSDWRSRAAAHCPWRNRARASLTREPDSPFEEQTDRLIAGCCG